MHPAPRRPQHRVTPDELAGDPYPVLAELRTRTPVCWVPALDGWLVTSREAVLRVLGDPIGFTVDDPRFSTAAVVGPSMLSLDGAEHARHRRPFAAAFRAALVETEHAAATRRLAGTLVARFRDRGTAEIRTELAGPLAAGGATRMLGLPEVDAGQVLGWYTAIVGSVSALSAGAPATVEGAQAVRALTEHVLAALDGRSATGQAQDGDGAGLLARAARAPAGLTGAEVAANAAVLLFGGIETVEGMISNTVRHLLADRALAPLLRADQALLTNAIEESLRLEPAAARLDRYTTVDTVLAGVPIPARDLVIASVGAANRDPSTFPDPDTFDPRRENAGQHLTFATGPHACLAAGLARLQTRVALQQLLALPQVRLDRQLTTAPRGLVFRKPDRVVIHWDP